MATWALTNSKAAAFLRAGQEPMCPSSPSHKMPSKC